MTGVGVGVRLPGESLSPGGDLPLADFAVVHRLVRERERSVGTRPRSSQDRSPRGRSTTRPTSSPRTRCATRSGTRSAPPAGCSPSPRATSPPTRRAERPRGRPTPRSIASWRRPDARSASPVPHIALLREHNVRSGFVEDDAFARTVAHLPAAVQPVARFGFITGWRLSEVLGLEWRQVDLARGEARLDPGTTKNGEGGSSPSRPRCGPS